MFDPHAYKEACARLTLGREKLEEMITMTKHTNKRLRRPVKTLLLAAAVAAALCVTALAAVPRAREAVLDFFGHELTLTLSEQGEALGIHIPELRLKDDDGRIILTVDGETADITDDLAAGEGYTCVKEYDDSTLEIRLEPDLSCFTLLCDRKDGSPVIVLSRPALTAQKASVVKKFSSDTGDVYAIITSSGIDGEAGVEMVTVAAPQRAAEVD